MGLLGDIVGGLAEAALEGIENKIQENITNINFEDCSGVGILFEHEEYEPFSEPEIRNAMVETIAVTIGNLLGIRLNQETKNKKWAAFIDDSYEDEGMMDAFVLANDSVTVKYGLYNDAECALFISGEDCKTYALQIKQVLEDLSLDNVRFYFGEIPFNEEEWLVSTEKKLKSIQDSKKTPPKMTGDKAKSSILLKKLNEIMLRDLGDIFDYDSIECKVEDSYYVINDGNASIEISSDFDINQFLYINYEKNNKTIHFSFQSQKYGATMKISLSDNVNKTENPFSITFFSPDCTLEDVIAFLENKKIETPDGFIDNLLTFNVKILTLLKYKLNISDDENDTYEESEEDDDFDIGEEFQAALKILELTEEATLEDIKTSYRRLTKEFHPDKMQGLTPKMQKIAEAEFQKVQDAYELLLKYLED